jgi:hypothetical protein
MAITVDIVGVGPVEFPDGMSKEAMEAALKRLPSPTKAPPPTTLVPSNQSNYVVGDVPSVVGEFARPTINQPQPTTSMMDKVKAIGEVPLTIGTAMIAQPVATAYGVASNVLSPEFGTQQGIKQGEMATNRLANALTYRPRSQTSQNVLESIGEAFEASKLPPYFGKVGIGEIPSFTQAARVMKPFVSEAATNVMQSTKPVVNKMSEALRTTDFAPKGILASAPSAETLAAQGNDFFTTAKNAGVQINPKEFSSSMKNIGKSLENLGYDPELHPDIKIVLKRLTDTSVPKDFNKIKALRTMINDLQSSDTRLQRSIATELKSNFDDYLATIPESAVTAGSKEGLAAWKQGMNTWSKLRKSEVFTDMLERSEIDKAGMGVEKSLTNQLRALAKDPKKMRLFTAEEQAAITQAAKGGSVQNILSQFGRFAPTSAVSSIPSILATAASAPLGLAATAGAIGSRVASTRMKQKEMTKLAALMRAGAKSPKKVKEKKNE